MPGLMRIQLNVPLKLIFVKLASSGSFVLTSMMSDAFRFAAIASISALVALPILIHVRLAEPAPADDVCAHFATYSVPEDKSSARSAMNMKRDRKSTRLNSSH